MSVSSSQASLTSVRADLDLSPAGGMTERAVLNKNIQTAGPIKLADFKGNVLGNQLSINKAEFGQGIPWPKNRYEGSAHPYISRTGDVGVSGNKILVSAREGGAGGGDRGTEYRAIGRCDESGTYRLTGKSFGRFSDAFRIGELHISLIANASDYLSGPNQLLVRRELNSSDGSGERTWNETVTLNASTSPFITLILRYIHKDGGRGDTFQHDFWDWKLVKV